MIRAGRALAKQVTHDVHSMDFNVGVRNAIA